jgi:hypothetical protein
LADGDTGRVLQGWVGGLPAFDRRTAEALTDAVAEARETNDLAAVELARQLLERRLSQVREVRNVLDILFPCVTCA